MIKVITEEIKIEKKLYPKIMKGGNTGNLYFMVQDSCGFILYSNEKSTIGEYLNNISMDVLTDYNEPITLQNV